MVTTLSLKNFQITDKGSFQTLTIFAFELKVAWKPFYKKLPMTKLWSKTCSTLCLTFPENGFNFVSQKFAKNWKETFQTLTTFVLEIQVAAKPFYEKIPMTNIRFKWFWTLCLIFPENAFNFVTEKFAKKLKNDLFKRSDHSFFSSRYLKKHLLRSFSLPNFNLKCFEPFASLSQKIVSTLPLKNLQKIEKCSIETLTTFIFELNVASEPFFKKIPMTKSWFK